MICPHFSKVKFQKIKQISNQQTNFEDDNIETLNHSGISGASDQSYEIPEEGIDHVNHQNYIMSTQKYKLTNSLIKQDSIKQGSRIKLPKQMNIKKMMTTSDNDISPHQPILSTILQMSSLVSDISQENYQNQQPYEQTQIPNQNEHFGNKFRNPHILVSKTSMMGNNVTPIYNGLVFLTENSSQPYECELKQFVIRISRTEKIKYFIELLKVKVQFNSNNQQNERMISMYLTCKNKKDTIKMYFMTPLQKQIFAEVYNTNIKKIKQSRQLKKYAEQNKQNILIFDQSEESAIFNELNQLQDNDAESISSLSLSSYEGDSLVFETERISFNEVRQKGNTFDILLFKNKSLMSKFQRIFTNSDYDHTAMLLRTANNELLMLQATSNAGVAIYTFNSLLRIDRKKYFSRIGLRRYTGEKNLVKIERLQNFIRKTVGKKYKFDPMYLIKSQANQDKQTFFCSQLVAEALQDVGILSNQVPSFKFLPKHFAEQSLNNQVIDGKFSETIILE